MAKATVITPKPVRQPPKKIILELTEGEADFLIAVLSRIGGSPTKSPRKYQERISAPLVEALGFDFYGTDAHKLSTGDIGFRNYDGSPTF